MTEARAVCAVPFDIEVEERMEEGSRAAPLCYIDVRILSPVSLAVSHVGFRNNYTASVSIVGRRDASEDWTSLVHNRCLMKDVHSENGATEPNFIAIPPPSQLPHPRSPSASTRRQETCNEPRLLRLYLWQPSPLWSSFSVADIQVYYVEPAVSDAPAASTWPPAPTGLAAAAVAATTRNPTSGVSVPYLGSRLGTVTRRVGDLSLS